MDAMTSEFIHSADEVYKELGYGRKDHLVRLLKQHFVEGDDWISLPPLAPAGMPNSGCVYMMNENCLNVVLARNRSRKPGALKVAQTSIRHVNRYLPVETEIITFLVESLASPYTLSTQYRVWHID